jgi:phosphatidylglycerophosphate synthase
MLANCITLSRFPLLLICVLALYLGSPALQLAGSALLLIGLLLDTVDGVVARRKGTTSLFGSVLDIAADRTYELVLWVCFADLGLITTVIPLIVVVRTTLTDALRAIGVGQGRPPFEQQRSVLGRFLVGSAWMRIGYSVGKTVTFCGLAVAHALSGQLTALVAILRVSAWLTVGLCLLRGMPVIVDSLRRHLGAKPRPAHFAGSDPA